MAAAASSQSAASATSPQRLAPHFPVVRVQCKDVAVPFFRCFTEHARMQSDSDVGVDRALAACAAEMAAYDACMRDVLRREQQPDSA